MESMISVMRRHPNFDPRTGTDLPTLEEIYAANTVTGSEMRAMLQEEEQIRRTVTNRERGSEEERRHEELMRAVRAAGIPPRFEGVTIDLTADLSGGRGLYIFGAQGSGKTTKACGILKGWISRGNRNARFTTSASILTEISATYDTYETEQAVIDRYGRCSLLVIDDLGKENPTDHALMKLWQVMDARYGNVLPTIITTQYSASELIRELSRRGGEETAKAIVSRLYETCQPISMGTVDHRREK